jgi:hypothetical protein
MRVATLVDVDALWHVALYSVLAAVGLVTAYGTAVVALERGEDQGGWRIVGVTAVLACLALLAVGFWAMTQK